MTNPSLEFLVIARNKQPIPQLLDHYKIPYTLRKGGRFTKWGKLQYLFYGNLFIFRNAIRFKPDVLLSHGGVYTALTSVLYRTTSVTTEDTEGAKMSHWISKRTSNYILTPEVFEINLGPNQMKFNSYMEYAYLHSNYFERNRNILEKYNLDKGKFVIVRFVDWTAHHDFDVDTLSYQDKIHIVSEIAKKRRVVLSFETSIPEELRKYAIKINPEDLHHLLAFASLYIGEGATTASEASILGTPAIYMNPMQVCYCRDQEENYDLSFNLTNRDKILSKAHELLDLPKDLFKKRAKQMQKDKINTTEFLDNFLRKLEV